MSKEYLLNKNRNSLWNVYKLLGSLRFLSFFNKWIWCGFQSKTKIERRYSTAKSDVSYKEKSTKMRFIFNLLISHRFFQNFFVSLHDLSSIVKIFFKFYNLTVSQICSFICLPSIVIILAPNSTPGRNKK